MMTIEQFDIETVTWSEPKSLDTKAGPRTIRTWAIPNGSAFWDEWKKGKLKAAGYSVSKWQGVWQLTEWRTTDGNVTEQAKRAADTLAETERRERYSESYNPTLTGVQAERFEHVREWLTGGEYEYQLPHIVRMVCAINLGFGVDASDTGTGKTGAAILAAYVLDRAVFVMSPLPILPAWTEMAALYKVPLVDAVNYEKLRTGKLPYGTWDETTKAKKSKFLWNTVLLDPDRVLLVADEVHKMKDYTTQNCKVGLAAIRTGYSIVALSATAADNPMQMKFLALGTGMIRRENDFFGWMMQNGVKKGRFGHFFAGGRPALTRIHSQIFPMHGSRMRISELGDKFPESKIISEAYLMPEAGQIQSIYNEMNAEIAKLEAKAAGDRAYNPAAAILVAQLRARQRAELLKVPTFVGMAQDAVEEGQSVVIFVNFEETLRALALRLQTNALIHGGQKSEDREAIRVAFQEDKATVLVCNIRAGGVGISLHGSRDSRPRMTLISPTFSGVDLLQCLGRVWRAGGARSVQKIVFAAGTCEEECVPKVRAKVTRIGALNDGIDALSDSDLSF